MRLRMRIALGFDRYLDNFARGLSAQSWREFACDEPGNWRTRFFEVMGDEGNAIFFNLDGVDVWKGITRAASGRGGPTDWELLQIQQNPQWWPRITWMKGNQPLPGPI
jgi:hypothetical protein